MSYLDRLVTWRILSRISLVILVFFGLICLTESLDTWRFGFLSDTQGQGAAILAIFANAARWTIKSLPVTVLIGAIIALLDLQSHRELVIIKAGGISVWRIMRFPVISLAIISIIISVFIDAKITQINRSIMPSIQTTTQSIGKNNQVWLQQKNNYFSYVIEGKKNSQKVYTLKNVNIFLSPKSEYSSITASEATLVSGKWELKGVNLYTAGAPKKNIQIYSLPTFSTRAELELRLASTDDFTFFELKDALSSSLADPIAKSAAQTRFARLLALPALLVGVLLIAFAFSSKYRRTGALGSVILSGVVLGFVVFVITEMAYRAGSSGVISPLFAAWGPAMLAIVIGVSILLFIEDGVV